MDDGRGVELIQIRLDARADPAHAVRENRPQRFIAAGRRIAQHRAAARAKIAGGTTATVTGRSPPAANACSNSGRAAAGLSFQLIQNRLRADHGDAVQLLPCNEHQRARPIVASDLAFEVSAVDRSASSAGPFAPGTTTNAVGIEMPIAPAFWTPGNGASETTK